MLIKRNVLHDNMNDQIKKLRAVTDIMIEKVIKNILKHTNGNSLVNDTKTDLIKGMFLRYILLIIISS